jgi:hypothetical protein
VATGQFLEGILGRHTLLREKTVPLEFPATLWQFLSWQREIPTLSKDIIYKSTSGQKWEALHCQIRLPGMLLFYRNLTAAGEREAALPLRARFPQRPGEVGQWQKRTVRHDMKHVWPLQETHPISSHYMDIYGLDRPILDPQINVCRLYHETRACWFVGGRDILLVFASDFSNIELIGNNFIRIIWLCQVMSLCLRVGYTVVYLKTGTFNGEVMIIDDKPDKASNLVLCFQTNPSHRNRLVCIREVGLTPSHQTHYIGLDLHFQDQRTALVSGALGF